MRAGHPFDAPECATRTTYQGRSWVTAQQVRRRPTETGGSPAFPDELIMMS